MKRFASLLLAFAPLVPAQEPPAPEVLLARLYAYTADYRTTLPSLSCDESIVSQRAKKNKIKWEVHIESTLRELRKPVPSLDDPFTEEHTIHTVDGKPANANFKFPYFTQGGFANMVGFAHPERMPCIDYRVAAGEQAGTVRLEMSPRTDPASANCGAVFRGYHGVIVADPETGRILRSERTIDSDQAAQREEAYFASVEYGPQQIGNQTFWLPRKLFTHDNKDEGRMYVTYSNCHRFGSEVRILPGATETAPQAKPQ
jgi:hypothetical protein